MGPRTKIHSPHPVLIDTPVWRKYFLKQGRIFRDLNALMDEGLVCCLDLIVGELLYSAESEEEMKVLQDFTRVFPVLREFPGAWVEAARLAFQLRQRGKEMSLRDCYMAIMAQSHGVLLYTPNKMLRQARRVMTLQLDFFPGRRTSE
jgi:predicted nucleic acid-binding protein